MKKAIIFFSFILMFCFPSCEYSELGIAYFEVDVDPHYIRPKGEAWVILHNESGDVLGASELSNGASIRFFSKSPDPKIGVTVLYASAEYGSPPYFTVKSYLGVKIFSKWNLKPPYTTPVATCGDLQGDLNITINDARVGGVFASMISSSDFFSWPDPNSSNSSSLVFRPVEIRNGCDHNYFLYVMGNDAVPRYKTLDNAGPGNHTYSLDDFAGFDQIVAVSFPPTPMWSSVIVNAFDNTQSVYDHALPINYDSEIAFTSTPSATAAYLNKYPKFTTSVDIMYDDHRFNYEAAGAVPSSIDLPLSFNPVIDSKNFSDYSFTVNQSYEFRDSFFVHFSTDPTDSSIEWDVFADSQNTFKNLSALPQKILDKYPGVHIEKLVHNTTRFYVNYKTIDEYVAEEFQNSPRPETYTYISKSVFDKL